MIVIYEPVCWGAEHVPFNVGLLRTACAAFPSAEIEFVAERSHLEEVQSAFGASQSAKLVFRSISGVPRRSTAWSRFLMDLKNGFHLTRGSRSTRSLLLLSFTRTTTLLAFWVLALTGRMSRTGLIGVFHTHHHRHCARPNDKASYREGALR